MNYGDLHYLLLLAFNRSNKAIVRQTAKGDLLPGQPKILEFLWDAFWTSPLLPVWLHAWNSRTILPKYLIHLIGAITAFLSPKKERKKLWKCEKSVLLWIKSHGRTFHRRNKNNF